MREGQTREAGGCLTELAIAGPAAESAGGVGTGCGQLKRAPRPESSFGSRAARDDRGD